MAAIDEPSAPSILRLPTPEACGRSCPCIANIGGRREGRFVISDIPSCRGRQTDQSTKKQRSGFGKDTVAWTRVRRIHLESGESNERRIPPTVPIKR